MDVSFTNVLEGARQYFQGLPVPSTAGANASTENLATSTPSSYNHAGDMPVSSTPTSVSTSGTQETSRYSDSRLEENGPSSSSYWNPPGPNEIRPVEPYPPQPTRVEVPDTRPGDDGSASLESSSTLTPVSNLTEMQPPGKQQQQISKQSSAGVTERSSPSPQLHQMQPPKSHSPPPVYQQLNNVSRTPFSTAEILTSQSGYQSASERPPPSSPMVAQRTQYYPRYHHPDITKSAPVPLSHSSTYQSANAPPSATVVHQPAIRPSPIEQSSASSVPQQQPAPPHQPEQRVPSAYTPSSSQNHPAPYGVPSSQGHNPSPYHPVAPSVNQHPQSHPAVMTNTHNPPSILHSSNVSSAHIPASHSSSTNPCSPHHSSSSHIPSPHNLPAHIPSPHLPAAHAPSPQNPSRINPSPHVLNSSPYPPRVLPHIPSSHNSLGPGHMPPPPPTGYHTPSPHEPNHHTPSPQRQSPHVSSLHNPHASPHHPSSPHTFQPHSPTYPPPPRSSAHSYPVPATSQHYQTTSYASPYPPQSYHSFQKNPAQGSYYSQPSRSQSYAPAVPVPSVPQAPTSLNNSSTYGSQAKPITYNGADGKRNSMVEAVPAYGSYQTSIPMQRSSNTHNLPPIAALSSYHSNRSSREPLTKAQPAQRQRTPSINSTKSSPVQPSLVPQRVNDYSAAPLASTMNHSMPLNGRTTTVASSTYPRFSGQQSYPQYATTIAPSHHGSNSSSTTVTSIGATRPSVPAATPVHTYSSSNPVNRSSSSAYPALHAAENYAYKEYPAGTSYANSSASQSAPVATMATTLQTNGVPIRKRESPLDLSVKTVKTPADSTAQDDFDANGTEKHQVSSSSIRSSNNRAMLPPQLHPPPPTSYSAFDPSRNANSSTRNPTSCVRVSTPQTVCAPKVDFLPDFNSTPLQRPGQSSHENPLRRSTTQQFYAPAPHTNPAAPLPHMSTFKKSSLPTPVYDKTTPYHPNSTSRSTRYPPVDPTRTPIPVQEYSPDPTKYYMEQSKFSQSAHSKTRSPAKRTAEPVYTGPSKQPRLDTWRLTIDQQIEQRLSTARALHEQQQRQEMSLPGPIPNGAITVSSGYDQRPENAYPSESPRYQAFCDKRNYPDGKIARSSLHYNHAVLKSPGVHSNPQPSSSQASYQSYRHGQRMSHGGTVPTTDPPSNTGADKRVLSLLRNSLENKQQREEQHNSQQPILVNHNQQSFQNKVVAPVEPKTNIGRHNLSPFTAASLLERNSNTPPHYKFHVPRAVDSITQEAPRSLYASRVNSSATLPGKEALLGPRGAENQIHRDKDDGLAAILAAKIRTKAELKQVGTGQFIAKPTIVPPQDISVTPKDVESAASTSTPQSGSSAGSPPKLTREKTACLPLRRRLFSKTEEENMPVAATIPVPPPAVASTVPPRASGFRSSSETSVFDFRESDSEGEMPVLERQTLEEMRRDRKQLSKVQPPVPLNDAMCIGMASSLDLVKIELKENDKITELDPMWAATCDKFMEQLRSGDAMKKRGRRKKPDGTAPSKLDASNESNKDFDSTSQLEIRPEDIKKEIQEGEVVTSSKNGPTESNKKEEEEEENSITTEVKTELLESEVKGEDVNRNSSDDTDEVPLIQRTAKKKSKRDESDCDEEIICRKRRLRRGSRIKLESSSGSESSSEDSDASTEFGQESTVADRLRARKRSAVNTETEGMKLRSRDTTPHKAKQEKECKLSSSKGGSSQKAKPKPLFGDGSDFRPGWEEEVYVYKKSLRMPTRLITVSKPSRFHRLSTSLPDLDPGSPALSVSMDSSDVCLSRKRMTDSDLDSNCSFSITGLGSKIDDEEATSSTTISCPPKTMTRHTRSENNSIVDLLAQKVGTTKKDLRKKSKDKFEKGAKTLPKGSNEPELLPTPSLTSLLASNETTVKTKGKSPLKNNKSPKPIKVTDSFLLGYFRKETVNNFRDTFKNNHAIPNEFSTFVLKSRTRTETRVLKKQTTIREVFGEDRPASAPPMQNHAGDTSQDDDSQNEAQEGILGRSRTLKQKVVSRLRNAGILRSHKAIINSKRHLLSSKRRKDLLKSLAEKQLKHIKKEVEDEAQDDTQDVQEMENNEAEVDNADEAEAPNKKKLKLRTGRRKFRSGFDYIRKKKKPLKKDETITKERKRQILPRPSPECVADIQSEIRTWVIKKGVGETILHRAARLGYTDVTAYCLEKLNSAPSPKDNAGYTPLHEACSRGHLEIAKLLLAYGANASESANGGIRPLHEAAESGATELVRLLLSYGADPLLATYSGQTPLMLSADTDAYSILERHLDDIQGRTSTPWFFGGPASIFDPEDTGYNPLEDVPLDNPEPELDEVEMEVSDINMPVLFSLANDTEKWVLLQDLMAALRVKSRDALLRQVNPKAPSGPPAVAHRDVMKELKLPDFLEQSRCLHLLSGGERINVRGSKVTLIKYNAKVKSLLNVERVVISLR
ncbi:mucin-17 [Cephus cinctus]|uniref:Mucin-17 n=1 Tax=Cephus cinctus TaxID=211228 RepID=A0AAJ7CE19_CEPCN|nr:mucin-17 [Cephus cinctus]XP_015608307.1 mucin-17 [Cephus cinctus]XP_024947124.1 mucin-17 [Cephus cinctus]